MEADKLDAENAEMAQSKLGFEKVTVPREFTREGILEAVVKLIATDDQVRSKWSKNLSAYLTLLVVGIGRQTCVSELSRCDATKNDDKGPPKHARCDCLSSQSVYRAPEEPEGEYIGE